MCGQEALLNFTNGKYVVFYLMEEAQPLPSSCFYGVPAIMVFLLQGRQFSLGPIYLLPQPGIRLTPSAVKTTGLPRKFLGWLYFKWLPSHHHLHPLVGTPHKSRTVSPVHWPHAPCPVQFLTIEGTQ